MTIPPPPPVPAARPATPPRRDGGHPTGPAAHEFTDLVRGHLKSEQARARTRTPEDTAGGPEHGLGAGAPDGAAAASALRVALAGVAGAPVGEQRAELEMSSAADAAASGSGLAGPAGGATSTLSPSASLPTAGAASLPATTNGTAAAGSPGIGSLAAGPPSSGPDTSVVSPVDSTVSSPPSPASVAPASSSQPGSSWAADLARAAEPLSQSASSSADVPAAGDAAAGSAARLDGTGPAVSAVTAYSAGPATSTTGSAGLSSSAGSVLDQALPVVTRLVSRGDGTHRMTLKLYPVELGEIQLTVTVRGDRVDVTFAAGAGAREALRDGAGQLRGLLELAGRTTGHLLVRDLPGTSQATPPQQAAGAGAASTGTPFGQDGAGAESWGGGQDSMGPGGSRTHDTPGRTERAPTGLTPTAAPTPAASPATALDVRL
jgi:hypothetical protein